MKLKLAAAVAFVAGLATLLAGLNRPVLAEAKEAKPQWEYKVLLSKVQTIPYAETRIVDGKEKVTRNGPEESAEAMTRQFNELAAAGWEYVGPATGINSQRAEARGDSTILVLSLFKRAK